MPGWIFQKRSCYYFSDEEVSSKKNWTDSRNYCMSKGGDLLVINNLEEQVGKKGGNGFDSINWMPLKIIQDLLSNTNIESNVYVLVK